MSIFETATRNAFRFDSNRGLISTEDLWDLPLASKAGFDLDSVAKAVNDELQSASQTSFVQTEADPRKGELETKLEIVKHIIAVKIAENEAKRNRAARAAEKERLLGILAAKRDDELQGLSAEELQARIAALAD
ncbi:hypothetical protein [Kineosporia sp. NBRC 101731]|uniref:hypothetical protein n=1 Tax=Kineosporia sp. NBRC 101731 TaxID=3032199 RepID=UPI0024A0525D|nr:hypothetical protein [Kineosporia sp. NBRC 101731]GLY32029.1 hypothetical protein Kisp02_53940 [Kineosporia sp. NBRC 101731]